MSQELHVLQCYSCETFQVHIVKKTNKWDCKICGERQSVKKVFGRGSGKDCRLHVQRLNEDKRRKETFVLNRRIQVQCAENAVGTEANTPVVKNSKWNKYLSEEEDDDNSDDSVPLSPRLRTSGTSAVCKEQTIQNYSSCGPVNIHGVKIGILPENWNEDITPHISESPSTYFSTRNNTHDGYKLGGINNVCEMQTSSSSLCFDLLPETLTTAELLNCDSQQQIISDISSESFTSNTWEAVPGTKQMPVLGVKEIIPTKSEINKQEEERTPVQLLSHIHGSFVTDMGTETINLKKNVKQIFSDKYNEDELDEILKI